MKQLYSLNSRFSKANSIDTLIYQEGSVLYYATIEKSIKNNQVHRYIQKSFEFCTIKNNDSPLTALFKYGEIYSKGNSKARDYKLTQLKQVPGNYYPRIFRPVVSVSESFNFGTKAKIEKLEEIVLDLPDFLPHDFTLQIMAVNQLDALKQLLFSIFDTIYPSPHNFKTYGQNIKNLLVLSCIEVETQLKGIFKANENAPKINYSTKDYVKLKSILKLDKYNVKFPYYPQLTLFNPFKNWSPKNPTKSINWYDSYNAIKHNGEIEYAKATLQNAILAFSAVAIIVKAQYGDKIPFWREKIGNFLEIEDSNIRETKDYILPPINKELWNVNKYIIE